MFHYLLILLFSFEFLTTYEIQLFLPSLICESVTPKMPSEILIIFNAAHY